MFTRSGSTWTQQDSKLTGGGETGAGQFGITVALSSDGHTALIGGPGDNGNIGAAWVFASVVASPDFALAVSPSSRTPTEGDTATFTVSITPSGGFVGTVSLSVAGLPSGATGSFDVTPVSLGVGSLVTITTAASTPVGSVGEARASDLLEGAVDPGSADGPGDIGTTQTRDTRATPDHSL